MKKSAFIILVIFSVMLTGCTKYYGRSDIKNYLEEEIGIKGYKLVMSPEEKEDIKGYTDYYWHVVYKDIEFDVVDDHYWGMESATNYLYDDFRQVAVDYYYGKYSKQYMITYKNDLVYNRNTLICEVADDQKEIDYIKLQDCYNKILDFVKTIDFESYPVHSISVEVTNGYTHVKWLVIYYKDRIMTFDEFKDPVY